MSSPRAARNVSTSRWISCAAFVIASGVASAGAETLVDPPVFASRNGVLDIMMVAMPQPIPGISFTPRGSWQLPIHPTGWVYQLCQRPASGAWGAVGQRDINGDGKADILFRATDGSIAA